MATFTEDMAESLLGSNMEILEVNGHRYAYKPYNPRYEIGGEVVAFLAYQIGGHIDNRHAKALLGELPEDGDYPCNDPAMWYIRIPLKGKKNLLGIRCELAMEDAKAYTKEEYERRFDIVSEEMM